jgi:hypothetical protein
MPAHWLELSPEPSDLERLVDLAALGFLLAFLAYR